MDCMRNHFTEGVLLDGRYKTVCPLNHGSFGLVFKAQDVQTGEFVALKCLTKSSATYASTTLAVDDRSEELAIHRHIGNHPNVVNLVHHFETEHHVYLVLEYCPNGDLYESIRAGSSPRDTERVREALLQLIDAVQHMHSRGVYHRDIKPENIFLSEDRALKIGDFGLATRETVSFEPAVGSDRYMAPEQMDPTNGGYQPAKADIWAIGICLLNVLFSRNPFATPTVSDPLFADFAADRQTLFDIFPSMSQDTFDILVHCLAVDPENRSLSGAKEAVQKAVCFTTDDEPLDEIEQPLVPVVTATANREPLRTPSITSPQLEPTGAFPWAKSLALTNPSRQLSVIADEDLHHDDLFAVQQPWEVAKSHPDNASLVSFVDSGLGLSVKSTIIDDVKRSNPVPICGSLPVSMARPIPTGSALGYKREFQSKSWSEIFKDDDESDLEFALSFDRDSTFFQSIEDLPASNDSNGSDTPRAALVELKGTSSSCNQTPVKHAKSEEAIFDFEEHQESSANKSFASRAFPRIFSPSKRSTVDKWAQLGDKRRQFQTPIKVELENDGEATPTKQEPSSPVSIPWRKRGRTSFRQPLKYKPTNWNLWGRGEQTWNAPRNEIINKEWNMSHDWRKRIIQPSMADDRLVF
jgi:serine/threonine protein kinase